MLNSRIKALLFADIAWFFGEGMLGPLFAIFAQRIGGNVLDISWAWAAYLIMAGLFIILIGKLSDKRINRKQLLFAGYALNAVLTFCYLLVHSVFSLLLIQVFLGIAAALATPTWDALYSEYTDIKERGFTWGLSSGLSEVFTGFAIVVGGLIIVYFSFSILFVIMGIIQVIATILLLPLIGDKSIKITRVSHRRHVDRKSRRKARIHLVKQKKR